MRNRRVAAIKSRDCPEHSAKIPAGKNRKEYDLHRVRPLSAEFYVRDPRIVARELLGKVLVRQFGSEPMAGRIVEVEAYLGANDAAAHAAAGLTPRNRVLFGPPGRSYVYFIYGNYYCLNVSCLPDGIAGGILFRALEPLAGLDAMSRNRSLTGELTERRKRLLTTGPGRLCEALDITRARDNDLDMTTSASGIWIGDDGQRPQHIAVTRRIGITKAADHPLRYIIAGNEFVSGPRLRSQ
jgi:DNA-3-methyladenine glycosylase